MITPDSPPRAMFPARENARIQERSAGPAWIYAYLAVQIVCQLALLPEVLGPVRLVFRSAVLGTSLLFLFIVPGRTLAITPMRFGVVLILAILGMSSFNPEGAGPLAVVAHIAFHVAVLAPVFWVARLRVDAKTVERILIIIWATSTASAATGVLQAYFPGQFQPNIGMLASETGKRQLVGLMIPLASGEWIPRPMGLTDTPGGAGFASLYACLLGLGIAVRRPFPFARVTAAASILVGAVCLYLCQIRSLTVMLGICFVSVIVLFALAGRLSRSGLAAIGGIGLALIGLEVALSLGGESVTLRLQTLVASDAGTVYYNTRGSFLETTFFELLPQYPLGAGLGRWGMVNQYFARGEHAIWAEIQWTAWLFDGGVLLMIIYPATVVITVWNSARIALRATMHTLETWSAVIAGYNVGALALTFTYPLFMSTPGVEFWLINAALIQAFMLASEGSSKGLPSALPSMPRA